MQYNQYIFRQVYTYIIIIQVCSHYYIIFPLSKQAFIESLDILSVENFMNNRNLTDSCRADLHVIYILNFIRQKW